ncbi:MAG: ribosome maturation factor RimM [Rhodospirillum sp.]|nr:ribosome maturation factor RimM [Rhodospirillum sp.]MCF8491928.1 ribosome maturation factor RimM [Rhodospirillum sp.]MCF8500797.1 ribosome maturation factor RimM [Rhodospirillum sp.]
MTERLLVGVIVGTHGVRGLLRVKSFTQDEDALCAYGTLTDEGGSRSFDLVFKNRSKGVVICALKGVDDRDAALALKGTRLYMDRSALPKDALEADEYYHADLIGLPIEWVDGGELGVVRAVHDFGAGDMLEVALSGESSKVVFLPFTQACVPVVDIKTGRLVANPPPGLLDDGGEAEDGERDLDQDQARDQGEVFP